MIRPTAETDSLLDNDRRANAERAAWHKKLAEEQEEALIIALAEPIEREENFESYGATGSSQQRPLVRAVGSFAEEFKVRVGAGPFLLGMRHWLERQMSEPRLVVWRIPWQVFTQSGGHVFMNAAIRLLRKHCQQHRDESHFISHDGLPEWLMWSLPPDFPDRDIQRILKKLPTRTQLSHFNPAGEVVLIDGLENRRSSCVAVELFCCGYLFCVDFPVAQQERPALRIIGSRHPTKGITMYTL